MPPFDPAAALGDMEDINGAFEIELVARFDALISHYWQRLIDFGNGPYSNNILLTQVDNTSDLRLELHQGGQMYSVTAQGALVEGETATWNVGIDPDGMMWIEKNGLRLAQAQGVVPDDVSRLHELLGESNWAEDDPLDGAVLGLDVINAGETADGGFLNEPAAITGAFRLDVAVRFDDLAGSAWQGVVDMSDASGDNSLTLTQLDDSADMLFEFVQGGTVYSAIAEDALVEGETAVWSIGIDADGLMWIEKDGTRLDQLQAEVPANVDRSEVSIGEAAEAGGDALDGVVLDLTVTQEEDTAVGGGGDDTLPPADDTVPPGDDTFPPGDDTVPPGDDTIPGDDGGETGPIQIDGAFQLDVTARFDDVLGGYWQRVFDFGDGPGINNILLTQVENTNDLLFEITQEGEDYRVLAENAIVEGEDALWSVGVETDGTMWIAKDGVLLAEGEGAVPIDVDRTNLLVGESNWPEDDPLIGEVSGMTITQLGDGSGADPDPGEDPPPVDDPVPGEDPLPGDGSEITTFGGDMIIVAHQDDDILFMNPTIDEAIDGDAPVTTIYLTAGDFGLGEDYWGEREAGEKDAYAHMAGASDWQDETVSVDVGGTTFNVASSYLASQPEVRLYFLRLPDGFSGTGSDLYNYESLEKLWDGSIENATTVDGTATYTSEQLQGVITALMELHEPDQIHIQDHTSEHSDLEHSDHYHASQFAAAAAGDYSSELTVTSYYGYATWGFEENVTGAALDETRATFLEYADHDQQVWESDGTLIDAYEEWLQREYVVEEYTHPGAAMIAAMSGAPGVEDASAQEALVIAEGDDEEEPVLI